METSLLVLAIGWLALLLARGKAAGLPWLAILAVLPWIRPDAVAIGLLAIAAAGFPSRRVGESVWQQCRRALRPLSAVAFGAGSLLVFNRLYFGQWLHQTIVGKQAASVKGHLLQNLEAVFLGRGDAVSIFNPLPTHAFNVLSPLFVAAAAAACWYLLRTTRGDGPLRAARFAVAVVWLLPLAYAFGGVLFSWYFMPSQWVLAAIVARSLLALSSGWRPGVRRLFTTSVAASCVALVLAQWLLAFNWGVREGYFRRGIGLRLRELTKPGDTLMLEPAGFIPYFSGLQTIEEVGLAAPVVTEYRKRYKERWFIQFLQQRHPDWLLERAPMLEHRTLDGYVMAPEEREWFDAHYKMVEQFDYRPEDYYRSSKVLRLLAGKNGSYYLYRYGGGGDWVER
jgi:hypothetical protein